MTTTAKQTALGYDNTVVEVRGPRAGKTNLPISVSDQAAASSANKRLNIPLNLENWRHLPDHQQESLIWFHQHILDHGLGWKQIEQVLPKGNKNGGYYDKSVIFKVLKGSYEGSWDNICEAILSYRDLVIARGGIAQSTFAENLVSKLIWGALDYALAANGIAEIIGESGQGKTISALEWQSRNNHGKTVYVECPVIGGMKGLLREICASIGVNKNQSILNMQDSIRRAFNANRILIIDEAHRLLPSERATPPKQLDILRWLHDQTKCGVALITTSRFGDTLRKNTWMFEQLIGRIDMPLRLPRLLEASSYLPLVKQYVPNPTQELLSICGEIVNEEVGGRMRRLDKLLKFAARMASKREETLSTDHVLRAYKLLNNMMGETKFAKK